MTTTIAKPAPRIRATTEEGITKALNLNKKESLNAVDHKAIASAAQAISKSLRKSNPTLASHLYYVHFKHNGAARKVARKAARKAAPVAAESAAN